MYNGSIHARAGKPPSRSVPRWFLSVYPRACGETWPNCRAGAPLAGLSPRVRGNPNEFTDEGQLAGSIPARAGKPSGRSTTRPGRRVYPRACGETDITIFAGQAVDGLSPRVRGNPGLLASRPLPRRSIPAHAGKPPWPDSARPGAAVYPRACGETREFDERSAVKSGLSPRVRGNRALAFLQAPRVGSIPARAGKPLPKPPSTAHSSVYPRACGETECRKCQGGTWEGLSPRVRGNPDGPLRPLGEHRSIPARAGKPVSAPGPISHDGVYPRACGETRSRSGRPRSPAGLSPRVRGNQSSAIFYPPLKRSIPARAGKPPADDQQNIPATVYPRACGETCWWGCRWPRWWGLSPRVRGNLWPALSSCSFFRSIPARAGKPGSAAVTWLTSWVYPRACGETSGIRPRAP